MSKFDNLIEAVAADMPLRIEIKNANGIKLDDIWISYAFIVKRGVVFAYHMHLENDFQSWVPAHFLEGVIKPSRKDAGLGVVDSVNSENGAIAKGEFFYITDFEPYMEDWTGARAELKRAGVKAEDIWRNAQNILNIPDSDLLVSSFKG